MTFEKLKISVAISLVLFVFIVGNIFAFGYLQKIYDGNQLKDKSQNTQTDLNTIIVDAEKDEVTPSSKTVTKEESKNTSTPSETTTHTTISHTTQRTVKHHRRTRAS
jgi:low affinity Fe/Cu permease